MPIIKSAIKRVKQAGKRRDLNIAAKNSLKTATKAFLLTPSAETLSAVHGAIDTAVKKNILKKNTAARRKSRLARIAKEAKVTTTPAKKAPAKKAAPKAAAKPETAKKTTTAAKKAAPKKETATKKAPAKKTAAKKEAKQHWSDTNKNNTRSGVILF